MKLFGRMTLMSLAVLLVGSLGFLSPMMVGGTVHGASVTNAPVITLTEYTPTYNIDAKSTYKVSGVDKLGYKLPIVSVNVGSIDSVKARMSSGLYATVELGDDGNWYLVTDRSGKFDIIYTAKDGEYVTTTRGISVEITTNGATLEFGTNIEQIIPSVAYAGNKIVFPRAKVMVDGEENAELSKAVTIKLTNGNTVKKTFNQSETGFMEYEITAEDVGDFTVTYTYSEGGKNVSKSSKFRVNSTEQEIALKYSNNLSSSLENLSLEVGVEATLPTPTVVNSKASDVDVSSETFTKITVKGPKDETYEITDYKFTPKNEGNYRISYVTTDFFGNQCSVSIQRDKIKLTANSLVVKAVKSYDPESTEFNYADLDLSESEWASHDYEVKSVLYANESGVDATFPAIIAKGGWGDYSNLKFTRTIWKNGSTIGTLESAHQFGGATVTNKPYEVGQYHFNDEGSYSIDYSAIYLDENGNEISGTRKRLNSYNFEVKKDTAPTTATETNLTITAPSIASLAVLKNADKKITFNAPSASDDVDTRLNVEVYYTFNGYESLKTFAKKNTDGTYEIEVKKPTALSDAEWASVNTMTITFKATNDFNQSVTDTKVISLLDFSADKSAPVVDSNGEASYDNNTKKVTLPTAKFVDASANATNVTLVMYVMKDNKVVDIYNGSSDLNTHSATLEEFTYEPTQEGKYTFVYVASDQNLNTTTFSTSCDVGFQLGYSVSISSIGTQEYGDILDLASAISVTKDGKAINIENSKIAIASKVTTDMVNAMANESMLIQVSGEYKIDQSGANGRIKCLDGDIYVKAWVKDDHGVCDYDNNASSTVSFKSADTVAPEFTIVGESDGTNLIASYEFADNDEGNTHELPWFDEISDKGTGVNYDSLKVELTYSTSSTPFKTFTIDDANANRLKYTVTQQGKIKVVYTAADGVKGNTKTREFWVYVGDVLAPEIVIENDAITAPTKVGQTCTISLEGISFKNDVTLSKTDDLKISVTHNGKEVSWEYDDNSNKKNIIFTASEAGDYVVKFNAIDKAGNEATTVSKTISVKADSVNKTNSSTVWGTIMIIVSLIVVGVVIYFFVKPSRNKAKTGNSKKTK